MYSPAHTRSDVHDFIFSSEQIWWNLALHLLTMDPLQWMGAVRMRVQTADRNNKHWWASDGLKKNIHWIYIFFKVSRWN